MHGYSEPVRQRTMQSMKPRKPSGTRYCDEAEPVWTSPNRIPVITAAIHDAEVTAGDRHPHLAQRPEQEAAEEELLADRRDRADEHGRHHDRRVVVRVAQLGRELVLAVQVEDDRVDVGDDVVDDRGDHERDDRVAQVHAAEAELGRAGSRPATPLEAVTMISAAATKQRSKTMSPMIETTAVGWLTLRAAAGADRRRR